MKPVRRPSVSLEMSLRKIDPAVLRRADREVMTFGALCDLYLAEGAAHKKPSTIASDKVASYITSSRCSVRSKSSRLGVTILIVSWSM